MLLKCNSIKSIGNSVEPNTLKRNQNWNQLFLEWKRSKGILKDKKIFVVIGNALCKNFEVFIDSYR